MKKAFYFLMLSFFSLHFTACDNEAIQDAKQQKAAKDSSSYTTVQWLDTLVNIGTVKMGEKIEIKFRCKNTGTKPLVITNAKPGCGCTVADYTKEPIAPNAEGLVTAAFDTQKVHGGDLHKTIIVSTNSTNHTEQYLVFTGTVTGAPSNDKVVIPHAIPKK